MKRLIGGSLVLALFAFVGLTGVATATHSNGQGPDKDFADGTGQLIMTIPGFGVYPAQTHINGQNKAAGGVGGTGHFWTVIDAEHPVVGIAFSQPETLEGDLTCLNSVYGGTPPNQEDDSGVITSSTGDVDVTGLAVLGKHIDNGEPGSDASSPDLSGGALIGTVPYTTCPPPQFVGIPISPITQGNYIVHDGI
jgi:hypothetical protein